MRLAELQRAFWSMAAQRAQGRAAARYFVGTDALSATDRLGIYADMFLWRQVDSLREDFPKLASLHGDFYSLAQAYLARHPSRHPSLAQLGAQLPAFLADAALRADLADLAALEWARAAIFEESDAPVRTQPSLAQPLRFVPALRILDLAHDACALWQALEDGHPAPAAKRAPNTVVVWRKGYEVFHVRLDDAEAAALQRAMSGEAIEAVCEAFSCELDPVGAALRAIGSWFAEGWIVDTDNRSGTP
ncbi:MAG TPA: DNA-binding domain-containing protein [Polyangiales bacterium]|nr:DNA-binding domain-containing protein [Polyangiales bacterium]